MAAASSFGKIEEFDPDTDSWDIYCERLTHCFAARNINDDTHVKRAIMLSEMGKKAYILLRNLCAPAKPGDKTFAELVKLMRQHQHPTPSVIVERLKFHKRERRPAESVAAYGLMTQLTFPLATMLAFCRIIRKPDAGKF